MAPEIDPNVVFKNIVIAALLLGTIALAALAFQPGSVGTVGQGGTGTWNSGSSWGGGEHDDD